MVVDTILQALQATDDPLEKAAIVAEAIFALLPAETALAARRSVILHWFDQAIVEALLEDWELTLDAMSKVYVQLLTLPFIDTIPSGLAFQEFTREGLIKRYSRTQPELLQTAARFAAPYFEIREEDKKSVAEALFCYIVAGEQEASKALQNMLFEEASSRQDWQRLDSLLQMQEEAERLPFVQPLPRNEEQFLLQGLIHRLQGKREAAILDYMNALTRNSKSVLAYVSRGTIYAEQDRFAEALVDYNTALRLDKNFAQAYLSRGIVYTKQGKYSEALKENDKATRLGLRNDIVFLSKGDILNELGQYEDAVAAYDAALRLNITSVNAYLGKGEALNGLNRYNDALAALEEALRISPESVNAYISKGQALHGLERYAEALLSYEDALRLNPNSAKAYRGKGQALSRLNRYEEASAAFEQANLLDPQYEDVTPQDENVDEVRSPQRQRRRAGAAHISSNTLLGRLAKPFRSTRYESQRRPHPFWNGVSGSFAVLVVCIIIVISVLLFHTTGTSTHLPLGSTPPATPVANVTSTATAQAQETATAMAGLIYQDALNNPTNPNTVAENWDQNSNCYFAADGYHVIESSSLHGCRESPFTYQNARIAVDVRILSGQSGGLFFRFTTNIFNEYAGYLFEIDSAGRYRISMSGNYGFGSITPLQDWTTASALKQGNTVRNTLQVIAQGSNLSFYANGVPLVQLTDATYTSGGVAFLATSNGTVTADVVYSNLKVFQAP